LRAQTFSVKAYCMCVYSHGSAPTLCVQSQRRGPLVGYKPRAASASHACPQLCTCKRMYIHGDLYSSDTQGQVAVALWRLGKQICACVPEKCKHTLTRYVMHLADTESQERMTHILVSSLQSGPDCLDHVLENHVGLQQAFKQSAISCVTK
jgi:hypothetical protein